MIKLDMPNLVTCLNQAPLFEYGVVWFGPKNKCQKDTRSKNISLTRFGAIGKFFVVHTNWLMSGTGRGILDRGFWWLGGGVLGWVGPVGCPWLRFNLLLLFTWWCVVFEGLRLPSGPQCGRVLSLFNSFLALAGWAFCLKSIKKKHGLVSNYDYHSRLNS